MIPLDIMVTWREEAIPYLVRIHQTRGAGSVVKLVEPTGRRAGSLGDVNNPALPRGRALSLIHI